GRLLTAGTKRRAAEKRAPVIGIVRRIIIKNWRTSMGQNMQLAEEFRNRQDAILKDWIGYQLAALTMRRDLLKESELRDASRRFLELFAEAFAATADSASPHWKPVKDNLAEISRTRALQGFSPSETATFVFSLKQPLFDLTQQKYGHDG